MREKDSEAEIKEFLQGLDRKQDTDAARTTLVGRALSRSEESVHLAVRTGIAAVPIKNIERISSVPAARDDIVRIVVRNPEDVRMLLRVTPRRMARATGAGMGPAPGGPGAAAAEAEDDIVRGDVIAPNMPVAVGTCDYFDTSTITGGQADACDDQDRVCNADDLE